MDAFVVHVLELCSGGWPHWTSWSTFYRAHRRGLLCVGRACHEKLIYLVELHPAAIGVQSSARAAFLSRTPHGIGTPALVPECWRTDTDRSSHSEVALVHSYTKQNRNNPSLFLFCWFLKGKFLLYTFFFPFASSKSVYDNITYQNTSTTTIFYLVTVY